MLASRFRTLWTLGPPRPLPPVFFWSFCAGVISSPGRVFFEVCARSRLQLFCVPRPARRSRLALSLSDGWLLSCHPWPTWKTPSRMVFRLYWRRFRSLSCRGVCLSHSAPPPPAPSCSVSAVPLVCPLRAALRLRPTARCPPNATPAPRPLLLALSSHGVRLAWLEAPHRPCHALQLLTPVRLPLGRPVRGVLRAPPKRGNVCLTSTAARCDDTNARCGVRFSVKISRAVQCEHAAPTPRPTMTATARATLCCFCSLTPPSRPPYLWSSLRWTSSWWLCPVASLWTLSPLRSWIGFNVNPIFWLTIPDATSGSEAGPRLGSWLTARVDVHLRRLPRLGLGLLKVPLSLAHSLRRTTFPRPCVRSPGTGTLTSAHVRQVSVWQWCTQFLFALNRVRKKVVGKVAKRDHL